MFVETKRRNAGVSYDPETGERYVYPSEEEYRIMEKRFNLAKNITKKK